MTTGTVLHYTRLCEHQSILQDQIIASQTCFGGHMDVNCSASLRTLNVSDDLKFDTTYTHLFFTFFSPFLLLHFLAVHHPYFYMSTAVFTCPNDEWTGLCIKLWCTSN